MIMALTKAKMIHIVLGGCIVFLFIFIGFPFYELMFSGNDRVCQILLDYKYIDFWNAQGDVKLSFSRMTGGTTLELKDTHTEFYIKTHKAENEDTDDLSLHEARVIIIKKLQQEDFARCYLSNPDIVQCYVGNEVWTLDFRQKLKTNTYQNETYNLNSADYKLYEHFDGEKRRFESMLKSVQNSVLQTDGIVFVAIVAGIIFLIIMIFRFGCGCIPWFRDGD